MLTSSYLFLGVLDHGGGVFLGVVADDGEGAWLFANAGSRAHQILIASSAHRHNIIVHIMHTYTTVQYNEPDAQ